MILDHRLLGLLEPSSERHSSAFFTGPQKIRALQNLNKSRAQRPTVWPPQITRKCWGLGSRSKQTRRSLQLYLALTSTSVCAGTFCGGLRRGPVSGKSVPLLLTVLMLEEFQVRRGEVKKVRIQFIDGLWNTEWAGRESSGSRWRLAGALGSGNDRVNAGPASIQHHSGSERKIWKSESLLLRRYVPFSPPNTGAKEVSREKVPARSLGQFH